MLVSDDEELALLPLGAEVEVRWSEREVGERRFTSYVLDVETTRTLDGDRLAFRPTSVVLAPPSQVATEQRRRFVRIPCRIPIGVAAGGAWLDGRCRCLSAGGLRAALPDVGVPEVQLRFELPDGLVEVDGLVVRSRPIRGRPTAPGLDHEFAFAFVAAERAEARLQAFVLSRQRAAVRVLRAG